MKAAATTFEPADYWTGPLDVVGTAEINEQTCLEWDQFFEITKKEVEEFVIWSNASDEERLELFPEGYQIPRSIREWPANGDPTKNQANKLAPYVDVNNDNFYDYRDGDYHFYDLGAARNTAIANDSDLVAADGTVNCRARRTDRSESARRPLFGDKTFWWIFNDKGNLHTETNAPAIGMEIHGQAFAFATNDAVNDMTFYNFELINRSTFTLTDTYFASWVDPDLGNAADDYVGCDVERGFGFCYNGDNVDDPFQGQPGYGNIPPVIGIDFFEGPYQDADSINNEYGILEGQALNGLGYANDPNSPNEDTIIDNERFGMRRFVYYNIGAGANGDPQLAIHFYNYMRGIWQNGQPMLFGGDGLRSEGVESPPIPCAFMFPGTSDPMNWGTTFDNVTVVPQNNNWTEYNPGAGIDPNPPGDRRFLQSAGPFTLEPGNVNDITVGVVFGQAETGNRFSSLEAAYAADDKAQALFDNCFRVLNGPDAPDLTIQELDKELIIYLTNSELSNNYLEQYEERDPNIITPEALADQGLFYDDKYRFQGYQVFQVRNAEVSINEIYNPTQARLVFQADIVDGDTTLVNYAFDEQIQANIPQVMVRGRNEGISNSFVVNQDLFAEGNTELVNYKSYYYIAIAYATNNFKPYAQDVEPDPSQPFAAASDGQKMPYLASRRSATGGSVAPVVGIPHNPLYEENGTVINSTYGQLVQISRYQGSGNGGNALSLTDQTVQRLFEQENWKTPHVPIKLDYEVGRVPINVKVVDPLNVQAGNYVIKFLDELDGNSSILPDSTRWVLIKDNQEEYYSNNTIRVNSEQLFLDPVNLGISIEVGQAALPGRGGETNGYLGSTIEFRGGDPWLTGVIDGDGSSIYNWIRAGSSLGAEIESGDIRESVNPTVFRDPRQDFENVLSGTFAPYGLLAYDKEFQGTPFRNRLGFNAAAVKGSRLRYLNSVRLVITRDKSKWTRCPVVETQEQLINSIDETQWMHVRRSPSIDKDGNYFDTTGLSGLTENQIIRDYRSNDPNDPAYISPLGMGWFPGYAINMETGERMNMAFGEDTRLGGDNGSDMKWNPTTNERIGSNNDPVWGGKHYIYIFRRTTADEKRLEPAILDSFPISPTRTLYYEMTGYDAGRRLFTMLRDNATREFAWRAASWAGIPLLQENENLLQSDVRINLQVARPYAVFATYIPELYGYQDTNDITDPQVLKTVRTQIQNDQGVQLLENEGRPVYTFNTNGLAPSFDQTEVLKDGLEGIGVVPNPYYAISEYEQSSLDNVVKFINLPRVCNIKIYNMSGTLIRSYAKVDPQNFLDWDLNNQVGIPISSGVYVIHVEVPGVGEKILKWFGVIRPVDLNNF